jgi:shikimate kinase
VFIFKGAGKMTLQDALAIHLYLQAVDTIEERSQRRGMEDY